MKFVEKTCPKCGANLEFKYGDKEATCKYCNKSFVIEGYEKSNSLNDILSEDQLELVGKTATAFVGFHMISSIIIGIIAFGIIITVMVVMFTQMSSFNKHFDDNKSKAEDIIEEVEESIKKESEYMQSLDVLTDADKDKLASKSASQIKKSNSKERVTLQGSERLGFYLASNERTATLYDVYKNTYYVENFMPSDRPVTKVVYVAAKYRDVKYKDGVLSLGSSSTHGNVVRANSDMIYGYETLEDLYNDIDTLFGETVTATEGMYTN